MDFVVRRIADGVLGIVGELDIAAAPLVTAAVARSLEAVPAVTVDLSGTTFVDAAGIGSLIWAQRYATVHGRQLRFTGATAPVVRVLGIAGVLETLGLG